MNQVPIFESSCEEGGSALAGTGKARGRDQVQGWRFLGAHQGDIHHRAELIRKHSSSGATEVE